MKFQEVEWFSDRRPEIAMANRASDRKRLVSDLLESDDPIVADYYAAIARAEGSTRVARECGFYPLLSGGDVNLYALFVERALALVKPDGMVGLLTPSGIASDKSASEFFKSVSTTGIRVSQPPLVDLILRIRCALPGAAIQALFTYHCGYTRGSVAGVKLGLIIGCDLFELLPITQVDHCRRKAFGSLKLLPKLIGTRHCRRPS
jgi:hypothetical protein